MRDDRYQYDFGDLRIYDDIVWQEIQEENARFKREERIIALWSVLLVLLGALWGLTLWFWHFRRLNFLIGSIFGAYFIELLDKKRYRNKSQHERVLRELENKALNKEQRL